MKCSHCTSENTYQRHQKTHFDYYEYRCRDCVRQFNERTGTVDNFFTHRTEVVVLAVRYYYEFKTSLDDVVKLMAMRGIELSHQTVHNWPGTKDRDVSRQTQLSSELKKCFHSFVVFVRIKFRSS